MSRTRLLGFRKLPRCGGPASFPVDKKQGPGRELTCEHDTGVAEDCDLVTSISCHARTVWPPSGKERLGRWQRKKPSV